MRQRRRPNVINFRIRTGMARRTHPPVLVLDLITAVGPFAIDMYLPALPSMGRSLNASPPAVQMSLMAYFIAVGLCQLFYGPLSDIVGRKRPIYAGMTLFALGSIGCAVAPNIHVLIGFRVLRGFGACAGMTIPRAIVRDTRAGHEATRIMSLLMLIVSISPILAPLTGSFIIGAFGWRSVFGVLTGAATVGMLLATTQLTETRPPSIGRTVHGAAPSVLIGCSSSTRCLSDCPSSARSAFRPSSSTSEAHLSFSSITMHSRRRFSASALLLTPLPFLPSAR
jgi:multidrug resistance protein